MTLEIIRADLEPQINCEKPRGNIQMMPETRYFSGGGYLCRNHHHRSIQTAGGDDPGSWRCKAICAYPHDSSAEAQTFVLILKMAEVF
jgi:hypothetical protein